MGEAADIEVRKPWKVLIIDDDSGAHTVMRMALTNIVFNGRKLAVMSAFNAVEARQMIAFHPDLAIIFLDLRLETEAQGFELVDYMRNDLKNASTRIIVRVDAAMSVPEGYAVVEHAINDYRTKTELSAQRLSPCVSMALRNYCELRANYAVKNGVEIIVGIVSKLLVVDSIDEFLRQSLEGLAPLTHVERNSYHMPISAFAAIGEGGAQSVGCGIGNYAGMCGKPLGECVPAPLQELAKKAYETRSHTFNNENFAMVVDPICAAPCVLIFDRIDEHELEDWERWIFSIYALNLSTIFRALTISIGTAIGAERDSEKSA